MATISSMRHDMEAAKDGQLKADKSIVHTEENVPNVPFNVSSEKTLPAPEAKLMLESANKGDDTDEIIEDDYIGNVSYKMLKAGKKEMAASKEAAEQGAASVDSLKAQKADTNASGVEKEGKQEIDKNLFDYGKGAKSALNRIFFKGGMDGRIAEQEIFRKKSADVKDKAAVLFGRKGVVGVLVIVLLIGTLYILWNRKSAEEAAMSKSADANLPPVKEEVYKIADSNDATRISNLTALANIAVLYHIKQGADLPVSRSYIQLNEANPVTEFLQDAIRRYGQTEDIMHDPRHPDFYYAYRSADGNSIELTARLEDPESSTQCKNEDVCIYRKILTEEDIDNMSNHIEKYEP